MKSYLPLCLLVFLTAMLKFQGRCYLLRITEFTWLSLPSDKALIVRQLEPSRMRPNSSGVHTVMSAIQESFMAIQIMPLD